MKEKLGGLFVTISISVVYNVAPTRRRLQKSIKFPGNRKKLAKNLRISFIFSNFACPFRVIPAWFGPDFRVGLRPWQ